MKSNSSENVSLQTAALAAEAQNGNRMSFQQLVQLYQEDIYRFAYYRTYSQMDAEDLTQEIFEQAYRKMTSLLDPQRFRSWLYAIAVNRCNDFLRKRKLAALFKRRSLQEHDFMEEGKDMHSGFDEKLEKKRFWQQVRKMLNELSTMEREVFTLRFMDHRNINEIAAILNRNESTVKTHLYRALDKLKGHTGLFKGYREAIL